MNDDLAPGLKDYIAIAIVTIITTILGYFTARRDTRINNLENYNKDKVKEEKEAEAKDRENEIDKIEHCQKCKESIFTALKDANQILLTNFQNGTREDQNLRWSIIKELKDNYIKVYDRLDSIALTQENMGAVQTAFIAHQKEMCDRVHDQIEKEIEEIKEETKDLEKRVFEKE